MRALSSWRPSTVAIFLVASGACADPEVLLVLDLPSDIDFVGVVYRGPDDAWSGSPLAPVDTYPPRVQVRVQDIEYERVTVVGFRTSDLEGWTATDSKTFLEAPLEKPGPRRTPVLPAYSATSPIDGTPPAFARDEAPLPVSAWWAGECPRLDSGAGRIVEHDCSTLPCPATLVQTKCDFEIKSRMTGCRIALQGALPGVGQFPVQSLDPDVSCEGNLAEDGALTIGCQPTVVGLSSCNLHIRTQADEVPNIVVRRVELVESQPEPNADCRLLVGIEFLGSRLLTARRIGADPSRLCLPGGTDRFELLELQLPELELVSTTTLAPNLIGMVKGLADSELILIYGGPEPRLQRRSVRGPILAEVALAPEVDWSWRGQRAEPRGAIMLDVHVDPRTGTAAVLLRQITGEFDWNAILIVVDAETLQPRFPTFEHRVQTTNLWSPSPGLLEILVGGRDRWQLDLTRPDAVPVELRALSPNRPSLIGGRLLPRPADGLLLVTSTSAQFVRGIMVARLDGGPEIIRAFWEADRVPFDLETWPANPNLVLVGLARLERLPDSEPVSDSTLAFFDLPRRRFSSPSFLEGTGHLDRLRAHEDGAVYGLSPTGGRIIRITPAPVP